MKTVMKVLSVILCLTMLFGTVAIENGGVTKLIETIDVKASAADYKAGDIIEFGSYPQTDVTDSMGDILNAVEGEWKSYGYYSGSGNIDGQMTASDYMRYKDVTYNGNKYRGVTFDSYRPYSTEYQTPTSIYTYQSKNGYTYGNVYWFKYEPLKWRVLDSLTGLVVCDSIIDSQPYNNYIISNGEESSEGIVACWGNFSQTYYANDYANSSIRRWLTEDFYATAFSSTQQSKIKTTTLNNDGYYTLTDFTGHEDYDSTATDDKIFLLSYDEVLTSGYGFSTSTGSDSARQAKGSDYAKCQGLYVYKSSGSSNDYWLRSPGNRSSNACGVSSSGYISADHFTSFTSNGVRPAMRLKSFETGYNPDETTITIVGKSFDVGLDYYAQYWPDSSAYNADLAFLLCANACAVYKEEDIKNAYSELGFDTSEYNIYDYDGDFSIGRCGYSLGFKKSVYSDDIICFVSVRGTNNFSDGVTDITILTTPDGKHLGFESCASNIYDNLTSQINSKYSSSNIKYFITGHSLGASVANLLAVKLMENGVNASSVYDYNFAVPDVACKYFFPSYTNIFNLCNRRDVIPFLPGNICSSLTTPGTSWGKYGITYWMTKEPLNQDEIPIKAYHNCWLYLDFFAQKTNPDTWETTIADDVQDFIHTVIGWITKILCPVDVIITDTEGKKIASVIGGEVNYYDSKFGDVIIFTDGDKKVIFISGDNDYNVNLIGSDNGEMTYSEEKCNLLTGEIYESKTFSNVELTNGKKMFSPVSLANTADEIRLYVLNKENGESEGKEIILEIETDGTETPLNNNHIASFVADGKVIAEIPFCEGQEITEPTVPAKEGYLAKWESYTLGTSDIIVNAVYTPITYFATFAADGIQIAKLPFTVENMSLDVPLVPDKEGYKGKWNDYTLFSSDITINAVYEKENVEHCTHDDENDDGLCDLCGDPIIYTKDISVDGQKVGEVTFTYGDTELVNLPGVPAKAGYTGEWEYMINGSDIDIHAKYTPITYYAIFMADGRQVAKIPFNVESTSIIKPSYPIKDGYTFKGWTPEVPATMPANDMTFTAVFEKNHEVKNPDIAIKGYTKSLSVDYKSKLTFNAEVKDAQGYEIVWKVNDKEYKGASYTIEQATEKEYKITVSLVKDGKTVKTSSEETVTVNTGFFVRIIAFFRQLFGALPKYADNRRK